MPQFPSEGLAKLENAVTPWGEVVDLEKPPVAAQALVDAAEWYRRLRGFQEACRDVLRAESDRRGQRSFELDGHKVEVESQAVSQEHVYDTTAMWDRLHDAGLPTERLGALITMVPKVDGTVLRQLRQNPDYAKIIDECILSSKEKTRRVMVR